MGNLDLVGTVYGRYSSGPSNSSIVVPFGSCIAFDPTRCSSSIHLLPHPTNVR